MISVKTTRDAAGKLLTAEVAEYHRDYENRNDWKTLAAAEEIATVLNAAADIRYIAIDNGEWVSPRYDVIVLPKVGDEVSYAFNGDSYPCGKVIRVSSGPDYSQIAAGPDNRGETRVFYRRKKSGAWINKKTWTLVRGHVSTYNESF